MPNNITKAIAQSREEFDVFFNQVWGATDKELVKHWHDKHITSTHIAVLRAIVESLPPDRSRWKRTEQEPTDDERAFSDGFDYAIEIITHLIEESIEKINDNK